MADGSINVRYFDVILCVSRALDLLSNQLSDHHLRVAYIADRIAEELGLPFDDKQDVVIAGALHDVGAVSSSLRSSLEDYSLAAYRLANEEVSDDVHRHGIDGYRLLRHFPPFAKAAEAIRFHHVEWNFKRGSVFHGMPVPLASHILYLADRVSVLPKSTTNILEQSESIRQHVAKEAHHRFHPDVVDAFHLASHSESFWLDLVSPHKEEIIRARFGANNMRLGLDSLYELARLLGRIIDFRSPFTAIHSSMVARRAEHLARLLAMDDNKTRIIGISGFLHDLGKLAVPTEILDKPSPLTADEMFVIKQHPYYTHRILSMVPGLEEVNTYASLHHERLDGVGYPFRQRTLPSGARIIAVADVFTAISEKRPYRDGMGRSEALAVLNRLVSDGALDGEIVALACEHYDELFERHRL